MSSAFQLTSLPYDAFASLFDLSDAELAQRGALRQIADKSYGFPCRVSLADAAVGDELLLLPFTHQTAATPYRATGPIYVRRNATPAMPGIGEMPAYVTSRLMSVRAYDGTHMMIDAAVCEGPATAALVEQFFAREAVAYIHLHNAKRGCFSCEVIRAKAD